MAKISNESTKLKTQHATRILLHRAKSVCELRPDPCSCGDEDLHVIHVYFPCDFSVHCPSCGRTGPEGRWETGAVVNWNTMLSKHHQEIKRGVVEQ